MKYIRGFLMAWGCFCWIPCPYRKWNDEDRTAMVAMLPLVGTGLGLCTALVWGIISCLGGSPLLAGAVVTAAYFVMTGFIHLDGFMDVADAVMPRHPDPDVRRRILKDPHTGSFAAISMALMFLIFAASVTALSIPWGLGALTLIAVVTTSRCVSAVMVIGSRPMPTSQYITTEFGRESRTRSFAKSGPAVFIAVLVTSLCMLLAYRGVMTSTNWGVETAGEGLVNGASRIVWTFGWGPAISLLAAVIVCALTGIIIGTLDRRSLGGMNGDISGHLITSGEMAGMLAAAVLMNLC